MKLTTTEEELMQHLWRLEKAFMNELLDAYPEPKPAPTTVATLLKRMQEKEFVGYKQLGRSRRYFPLVKKTDYFSRHLNGLIRKFFDDSPSRFASFFASETDLTESELKELRQIVNEELEKKRQ